MGSASQPRTYPYLWTHPGHVRCAGSPERIAAEAPAPVAVERAAGRLAGPVLPCRGPPGGSVCRPWPAGPCRPEPELWRPRGPRTGEELGGAGCRAQPGVTHRGRRCACLAPVPHRRTVDRPGHRCRGGRRTCPGPVLLELPGTGAEFWIAGAYHQVRARRQSPWCTLWDVHPGQ